VQKQQQSVCSAGNLNQAAAAAATSMYGTLQQNYANLSVENEGRAPGCLVQRCLLVGGCMLAAAICTGIDKCGRCACMFRPTCSKYAI
jgi:hypothetical protein